MLEVSIFIILALFMLGGSIAMITNKQTVFSAFGFLVTMIGLAGMFALLNAQFLAIAQILVSVGAVVVLSMLTILTVNELESHEAGWVLSNMIKDNKNTEVSSTSKKSNKKNKKPSLKKSKLKKHVKNFQFINNLTK